MRLLPRRLPTLSFVIGASLGCLLASYLYPCSDGTALHQSSVRAHATVRKSSARLLGAVILPQRQLNTTAHAMMETWGSEMTAFRIIVCGPSPYLETPKPLHVIALKDAPDFESYAVSLHQTFAALVYLHDNYLDQYDWFLLADNRTYVNVRELERLLRDVDPGGIVYSGKPEELIQGASQYLCAGSPGIIVSGPALKAVIPHLKECADQLTAGQGEESGVLLDRAQRGDWGLGFCFGRVLGISCSTPFERFHHDNQETKVEGVATILATTTQSYYILHRLVKQEQLEALKEEVNSLELEIARLYTKVASPEVTSVSPGTTPSGAAVAQGSPVQPLPSATSLKLPSLQDQSQPASLSEGSSVQLDKEVTVAALPQSKFDVNTWSVIVGAYIHSDQRTDPLLKVPNDVDYEVQQFVSKAIGMVNKEENASYKLKSVNNVFLRYSPVYGRQCIMDLTLVDEPSGKVLKKRMNLASPVQSVPVRVPEEPNYKQVVNVIVPLNNVGERFTAFFNDFQREFLRRRVAVRLILVVYGKDEYERINSIVTSTRQWPPSRLLIVQGGEGEFARGRALHLGLAQLSDSDVAFFCDTDMIMTREFMDRCRLNPVQGRRVYYPIFFSYYNMAYAYHREAKPDRLFVSRRNGHWVSYSYGMVCLFKSDYVAAGGFNLSITGWGGEDTDFFTRVLDTKLEVLKAPDPGLAHRWHPKHCSPSLTPNQYTDCLGTRNEVLADKKQLASYIMYLEEHLGISPASLEVNSSSPHIPSSVT